MPLMIYCTAALTLFSDSISYITFLFSEWRIANSIHKGNICSDVQGALGKISALSSVLFPSRVFTLHLVAIELTT